MNKDHYEGFENEQKFHMVLGQALSDCPVLKARTVIKIIAQFVPDFTENLFAVKPCLRTLKYIGCDCGENECFHAHDEFFKMGELYKSKDFNGATYSIEGYRSKGKNRRIGSTYFEWVE